MILIKTWVPLTLRTSFDRIVRRLITYLWWSSIWIGGTPKQEQVQVSYGYAHVPSPGEPVRGGIVKFQRMLELFPNSPRSFNVLYLGSSSLPRDWKQQTALARKKRAKLVINQNGIAYPAWCAEEWEVVNQPMKELIHLADYVFYQSIFCKSSADTFLGQRKRPSEILYNAVDTKIFTPLETEVAPKQLVLLLGGTQHEFYRLESALRATALVSRYLPYVRLFVTGKLCWEPDQFHAKKTALRLVRELRIEEKVQFIGAYSQQGAPAIYRQAHILLHTQYNDVCPSTVLEAMASGLPIVYSSSGGTPELVGDDAGIGVVSQASWEQIYPPDPMALAEAILTIVENRRYYAEASRQRAVERFDLQPWLRRHAEVFESLL